MHLLGDIICALVTMMVALAMLRPLLTAPPQREGPLLAVTFLILLLFGAAFSVMVLP